MKPLNIAILVESSSSFGRGVINGIGSYAKIHGPWNFYFQTGHLIQHLPPQNKWKGEGIIARVDNARIAAHIARRNLPVVRIAGVPRPGWPMVGTRQSSISQNVVNHFFDRGFKRFAFVGILGHDWSELREAAFVEAVTRAGYSCDVFRDHFNCNQRRLGHWLKNLQKPVAIMTAADSRGRHVIETCRMFDVAVPEEVAVCGVDDNYIICNLLSPSLSSVPLNAFQIGYTAAEMLHKMIRGEKGHDIMDIAPLPVTTRQSTDLIAIEDPIVASAVRTITESATAGLTVKMLLQKIHCSRRTLEMRFQKELGRSPHDEITRVQLARATTLLAETNLKIGEIARLSGFSRSEYLNNVFRNKFNQTPASYRRKNHYPANQNVLNGQD